LGVAFGPGSEYLETIIAIHATLGVFLWLASGHPEQHQSLIAFTIWSSVVHGATMAVQSHADTQHGGHPFGRLGRGLIQGDAVASQCPCPSATRLCIRFASKPVLSGP